MTRRVAFAPCTAALPLLAILGFAQPAQSQEAQASWPQKPVRIVTPFAAGGNTDGNARIIAQHLGEAFGQQFIVDHRPGASGAIAAETVARSPADGYTLFLAALPQFSIVPALMKTSYDPARDFVPISNVGTFVTWNGLLAPAGTPKEIVERIAQEVARAAKDPKVAARLAANGVDPLGDSPQEFAATIAADIAFWTEAVKISGVQER